MRAGVVLGLVACGCSVFVRTPDPIAAGEQPSCASSHAAPNVDLLMTLLMGGVIVTALVSEKPDAPVDGRPIAGVLAGLIGVPYAISAMHGYHATGVCRDQEAAFEKYQQGWAHQQRAAPVHYGALGDACWPDGSCDPGLACTAGRCAAPDR